MATPIEKLGCDILTYNNLKDDRSVSSEQLNQLKIDIEMRYHQVFVENNPPVPRSDEERQFIREVNNAALQIITQDNRAETVPPIRRAVHVMNLNYRAASSASLSFIKNHKGLLYAGAALTMLYLSGLPGLILVGAIYGMDAAESRREPMIEPLNQPHPAINDERRLID